MKDERITDEEDLIPLDPRAAEAGFDFEQDGSPMADHAQGTFAGAARGKDTRVSLRILATTDLHGFLRGHDYATGRDRPDIGLSRIARLVEDARRETPNVLLFDNGDFLQGTPLVDHWGQKRGIAPGEIHPMIAAMNALKYDAATPGNHEFNFGLDYLMRVLGDARFPFVCANANRIEAGREEALLPPWTILERVVTDETGARHPLRIGVLGLLPRQTADWDRARLDGRLVTRNIVAEARRQVPVLRAMGADVVIALAHTGIGQDGCNCEDGEHVAVPLAAIDGIDALVCGHSHLLFPDPEVAVAGAMDPVRGYLHGKPAVLPGRWGSHLGVIDLELSGRVGGWRVSRSRVSLRPVAHRNAPEEVTALAQEDPRILEISAAAHHEIVSVMDHGIGQTTAPLHSFFSMAAPDAHLSLLARAKIDFLQDVLAGQPEAALPILAAVSPAKFGGRGGPGNFVNIPAGPLRMRNILDLYNYPNLMAAVRLTGAQIAAWLEWSASAFHRIEPGLPDQALIDPAFPIYNFDALYGLTYEIDLRQPARHAPDGMIRDPWATRIRDLCRDGRPVRPEDEFLVATNSFRGHGGFPGDAASWAPVALPRVCSVRRVLIDAIGRSDVIAPARAQVWRFAPIPGASAWFETAPAARERLEEMADLRLEVVGVTGNGFLKIRMGFPAANSMDSV